MERHNAAEILYRIKLSICLINFYVSWHIMIKPLKPVVVIPARLAATRFPDKPLAPIHGSQ